MEGRRQEDEGVPPEFECSICMRLLLEPVTVSCGHTFCRLCLERSLGYRGLCAVCRAPIAAGQGVNILVRSIIAERFPNALAQRHGEVEEELRVAERAAHEARLLEAQGPRGAAGAATEGGGGIAPVLLPLMTHGLGSGLVLLPHCPTEVELRSDTDESLLEYALQGGRRLGIISGATAERGGASREVGVCFEIEHLERPPHQRRPRARLAGKFRFKLTEPPQAHEHGFALGRCEAFFDEALPTSDLQVEQSSGTAAPEGEESAALPAGRRPAAEIARDLFALLEAQLRHVGHSGRRVFGERFGDLPAAPSASQPSTSASLERLSFWMLGALTTDEAERRHWLSSVDTRARLEHCESRLEAAGQRPVLNLPGASSWMSPGQSAFKSLALLVAIIALFLAKAMGVLEPGGLRLGFGGRGSSNNNHEEDSREDAMHDAFAFGQLLR